MPLETKIKKLLEDANDKQEEVVAEGDTSYQNGQIEKGKSRKLDTKQNAAPSETGDGGDGKAAEDNAKIESGKSRKVDSKEQSGGATNPDPNAGGSDNEDQKKNRALTNPQSSKVKEHMDALTDGEELSEEFKTKAATILEAAIAAGVEKEMASLEEQFDVQLSEAVESVREELIENIDGFFNLMVETWMEENELALESGIKNDVMENFIDGMKKLFTENYIEVPEAKRDIVEEQAKHIEELTKLVEDTNKNLEELSEEVEKLTKTRVLEMVGESLTDMDFEKFKSLSEGVEFVSEENYENKLKTLKESYFPKTKRNSVIAEQDDPMSPALTEGTMGKYVEALSGSGSFKR